MFDNLSDRLERSFKILKGEGQITGRNAERCAQSSLRC